MHRIAYIRHAVHEVQNSISITSVLVSNLLTAETGMDLIGVSSFRLIQGLLDT